MKSSLVPGTPPAYIQDASHKVVELKIGDLDLQSRLDKKIIFIAGFEARP